MSPALAFLGGFLWDALTIGKAVTFTDLMMLLTYWIGAGAVLTLMARGIKSEWNQWFTMGLQFFFGGLFSALVILYFKSSGTLGALFTVILLTGLLIGNEFLQNKYERRYLSWILYCLTGTMYLNFMIPHIFKSVHPVWFFVSTLAGFLMVLGIWRLTPERNTRMLIGPGTVSVVLVLFFLLNWLPPVPLVLKQNQVCREFKKVNGEYTCQIDEQGILASLGLTSPDVVYTKGERVWCLSSVFAPEDVVAELEHRWWSYTEKEGWRETDRIPLRMRGGRQAGWRFYSNKRSLYPGKWRVETAKKDGPVMGHFTFYLVEPEEGENTTEPFTLQ